MRSRTAHILVHDRQAGVLEELDPGRDYRFTYREDYHGPPVSLTLPVAERTFRFGRFPAVFDGLLPEGVQLSALLRHGKFCLAEVKAGALSQPKVAKCDENDKAQQWKWRAVENFVPPTIDVAANQQHDP